MEFLVVSWGGAEQAAVTDLFLRKALIGLL